MAKDKARQPATQFFISVIGIVIIFVVLKELSNIFIPLVIALFLYFVFNPLNTQLKKIKIPLPVIILLDIFLTGFVIWGLSAFIIDSFMNFGTQMPQYITKLNEIVRTYAVSLGIRDPYFRNFDINSIIAKLDYKIVAGSVFSSTFSILGGILFILFFFIFVATGYEVMYNAIKKRFVVKKIISEEEKIEKRLLTGQINDIEKERLTSEVKIKERKLTDTFKAINTQIQRYIIAKLIVNTGAGISSALFLYLIGIDFPIIWGLFVFMFNFVPTIGSAAALILPVLMALIQYGTIGKMALAAGGLALIQTLFFNLVEPAVIGRHLNLNPLLILISVLVWGYIWGVVGMLIAVPLTAIIKIIIGMSDSPNMTFLNDFMSSGSSRHN
jgi:predicted PurR-regulated permease PerM